MTIQKKLSAALLLFLLLPMLLPCAALAGWTNTEPNRFDAVLVVDKSGSLICDKGHGTDPDGLRFDALRLFLALMTENGNRVGAITFDEDIRWEAAVEPLDGMEAKTALIRKLEGYSPGYDTDIGRAMLRATELLAERAEEDGGQSGMILLFSDGMTDFTTGDIQSRFRESWYRADEAVKAAQEYGFTVNGVLLNADGTATYGERGREEFRLYAGKTNGEFEEVQKPEDLTNAFRRLYHILNKTDYTGEMRVSFSEQGEAEIFFAVPGFGVEEVNVIVEGEKLRDAGGKARVEMEFIGPDGEPFDFSGHELDSSRYRFVKIADPDFGIWRVRLKGEPNDWVDVTEVYNPSLTVMLSGEDEIYSAYTAYTFWADVTDEGEITDEQLSALDAVLTVEDLTTGAVRAYAMEPQDGAYTRKISFPKGGDYLLAASVGLGDFRVHADPLELSVQAAPLKAKVSAITDILQYGRFRDDCWELELDGLFGVAEGSGLSYALSDDFDGVLQIENGLLRARFRDTEPLAFTLTASDPEGQSAEIAFEIAAPAVEATLSSVSSIFKQGRLADSQWEIGLDGLFEDPKNCPLAYTLSDDCGGAVTIEDDTLRVRFLNREPLSFVLSATDIFGQSAELPFDLTVPSVATTTESVTNMLKYGRFEGGSWKAELDELFIDPSENALQYALSDDCGGALTIEDGILCMDVGSLKEAAFSVIATDVLGLETELPFSLKVPGPSASVGAITETVKTGLFQEGTWSRDLRGLFKEPKGTALQYSLSDDLGGAAKLDGGKLHVDCKGIGKNAAFNVTATDAYGLSASIPVTLTEKNMTRVYATYGLLGLLAIGAPLGTIFWLRRRRE